MYRSSYISFFIFFLIFFLLDLYVFQGVKILTEDIVSVFLRKTFHLGYWMFFCSLMTSVFYTIFNWTSFGGMSVFAKFIVNTVITLFITKFVFIAVLLGEDVYRLFAGVFNFFINGSLTENNCCIPARKKFMSQLGIILAGIPFMSFIYGVTKGKYNYKIHHHTLHFNDLPENFDGFTITQLSDIHAGSLRNKKAIEKGIKLIKSQNSDIIVFTGDLVNNEAREIELFINQFKELKSPYGKFSILGNHDYGDYISWKSSFHKEENFNLLKKYHQELGFCLLLNENVYIEKNGQRINLLGVENWGVGFRSRGDLSKALKGVNDKSFKILLSHDPSHWEKEVKKHPVKIHLTLSGHTHGFQMGIELFGIKWSPIQYRYPNWAGLTEENEKFLYINRGFGFHGFSGRVGIWPEITVIKLRKRSNN